MPDIVWTHRFSLIAEHIPISPLFPPRPHTYEDAEGLVRPGRTIGDARRSSDESLADALKPRPSHRERLPSKTQGTNDQRKCWTRLPPARTVQGNRTLASPSRRGPHQSCSRHVVAHEISRQVSEPEPARALSSCSVTVLNDNSLPGRTYLTVLL